MSRAAERMASRRPPSTVPAPPILTAISSRRSRKFFVPVGLIASSASGRADRHRAADDHAVVMGVGQADLAGHEQAADVEIVAQFVGAHARRLRPGRWRNAMNSLWRVGHAIAAPSDLVDAGRRAARDRVGQIFSLLAGQPLAIALLAAMRWARMAVAGSFRIACRDRLQDDADARAAGRSDTPSTAPPSDHQGEFTSQGMVRSPSASSIST